MTARDRRESSESPMSERRNEHCRNPLALACDGSWSPSSFQRELSILVVRGADGKSCTYPLAENEHEEGILRTTMVPAPGSSAVAERVAALALQVVDRLEGVGVFCLELFQLSNGECFSSTRLPRGHITQAITRSMPAACPSLSNRFVPSAGCRLVKCVCEPSRHGESHWGRCRDSYERRRL